MGWINKRFMQSRAKWGRPISEEKRRAPLRAIAYVIRPRTGMFDSDTVMLECGHRTQAYGDHRARCTQCLREPGNVDGTS